MSILKVLTFPDPRLREISKPVTKFDDSIKKLSKDLLETMYAENGIGLAAAQVGELSRMLVVDISPRDLEKDEDDGMTELERKIKQPLVIINPEITKHRGKTKYDEGCLSVPSIYEEVDRFEWIQLAYQDVDGNKQVLETDGLLAICIQHEMDHLEGTLFIDHLSFIKSNKIKNQIKKNGYPEKRGRPKKDDSTTGKKTKALQEVD